MASSHSRWQLYEFQPSFVIGFHGCDKSVGEAILRGDASHLKPSVNDYDWLGHGIYFWEGNPQRALEFATQRARGGRNSKGSIKSPFVLGAVIDLRHCLDLLDSSGLQQMADAYTLLRELSTPSGWICRRTKGRNSPAVTSIVPSSMACISSVQKKNLIPTIPSEPLSGKAKISTPMPASSAKTTSKYACAVAIASRGIFVPYTADLQIAAISVTKR